LGEKFPLFSVLKENGYHVHFLGKNDMFSAMSFNLSVSLWANSIGSCSGDNPFPFGEAGYYSFLRSGGSCNASDAASNGDTQATDQAIQFLLNACVGPACCVDLHPTHAPMLCPVATSPPEPFVLFLPTRGAHPPYGAPVPFSNMYTPEQVGAARGHVTGSP
jgi:hypothetical protein